MTTLRWARIIDALGSGGIDADEFETAAFIFLKQPDEGTDPEQDTQDRGR